MPITCCGWRSTFPRARRAPASPPSPIRRPSWRSPAGGRNPDAEGLKRGLRDRRTGQVGLRLLDIHLVHRLQAVGVVVLHDEIEISGRLLPSRQRRLHPVPRDSSPQIEKLAQLILGRQVVGSDRALHLLDLLAAALLALRALVIGGLCPVDALAPNRPAPRLPAPESN